MADDVIIHIGDEISEDDISAFNREYDCNLEYHGFFGEDWFKGKKRLAHYSIEELVFHRYSFFHPYVHNVHVLIEEWKEEQNVDCSYIILPSFIDVISPQKLSQVQIKAFEEKTGLKCRDWFYSKELCDATYSFE